MTTLGGRAVADYARMAGFSGVEVKRAQTVAFAATRWQDHYTSEVAGLPGLTQWGLFATNPNDANPSNPRSLFDPLVSATHAHTLWLSAGGVWDWHPVVRAFDGALVRAAWRTLDELHLWASSTRSMASSQVPLGHPDGTLPPGLYPRR